MIQLCTHLTWTAQVSEELVAVKHVLCNKDPAPDVRERLLHSRRTAQPRIIFVVLCTLLVHVRLVKQEQWLVSAIGGQMVLPSCV